MTTSCSEPQTVAETPPEPFFQARRQWSVEGKPESLLAADLDGDGRAELVAALQRGALVLWRGTPDGLDRGARTFDVDAWPLRPAALPPGSFGAADGRRLVAVASRAERTLVLLDLSGGTPPRELWRGSDELATPRTLAVGDLGADGTFEIAMATDGRELVVVAEDGSLATHALGQDLPRCSTFLSDGSGVWVGFQDSRTLEAVAGPRRLIQLEGIPRDVLELDFGGVAGVLVVGGDRNAWVFGRDGTPFVHWPTGPIPIDVESADLDGDGAPEIAVLTRYGLSYELGPRGHTRGYAGQTPTSFALADFTGDGDVDLAIANRDARAISMVHGDGAGGVLDVTHVRVGLSPAAVTTGQLLGDGLPEVVAVNSKSLSVSVLRNEDGVLALHGEARVGPSPRAPVVARLFDHPAAVIGVVAQDLAQAWIELITVTEEGLSGPAVGEVFGRSGSSLQAVALRDRGYSELFVADTDGGAVHGLRSRDGSRADGLHAALEIDVAGAPAAARFIELDAGPRAGLAIAVDTPGPGMRVLLFDLADEQLVDEVELSSAGQPLDLAVADLDGDGRQDVIVLALVESGSVRGFVHPLLRSPSSGELTPLPRLATGANPHHLAVGDVDGDGLDDLFVDSQNSHVVNAWLTRKGADGVDFRRLDDIGAHLGCLDVDLADVNGDGRLDLLVANGFSDDVSVILNLPR